MKYRHHQQLTQNCYPTKKKKPSIDLNQALLPLR